MEKLQYVCPKCGCTQYESDQFQATGGNFAKLFDVQNKKFVTVSCVNCGYTELYKAQSSDGWNVLTSWLGIKRDGPARCFRWRAAACAGRGREPAPRRAAKPECRGCRALGCAAGNPPSPEGPHSANGG